MKKTLIASAVAAATLSTFSAMTLAAEAAMPKFYGNLQLVHSNTDYDSDSNEPSVHEFKDTGSTFGFTHDHELDSGSTVFMKAELEYDGDEAGGTNFSLDEAYVGVKGGFGSAQVGSDETVYDWIDVVDLSDEFGLGGGIAVQKEGDNFQYVLDASDTFKVGATLPLDSDSNFGGALGGQFSADMLTVALSYAMGREEAGYDVGDTFGLGASFKLSDAVALNAQYESHDLTDDEEAETGDDVVAEDFMAVQGVYTMGANAFRLGYAMVGFDKSDRSDIELAVVHTVSSNTYVYVESVMQSTDPDVGKKTDDMNYAVGVNYSF